MSKSCLVDLQIFKRMTLVTIIVLANILAAYYETDIFLSIFFFLFRATPTVYGGSQARGRIGAAAAGLCHSHSNLELKLHLQPIPQLTAMPEPQPTEQGHILTDTNWVRYC